MDRRRTTTIALLLAVAVAAGLALVLLRGDEGDEIALRAGAPEAGFPLRGDLADDAELHRDAAQHWRETAEANGRRGDEARGDITVLWAGHTNPLDEDEFGVVLTAGADSTLVKGDLDDPAGEWAAIAGTASPGRPGVVAFDEAALVPAGVRAEFVPTDAPRDPSTQDTVQRVREQTGADGLWRFGGRAFVYVAGALVLPDGLGAGAATPGDEDAAALLTARRPQFVGIDADVRRGLEAGSVPMFRAAGGGADSTEPARDMNPPTRLSVLADRDVPGLGPVLVLAEGPDAAPLRATVGDGDAPTDVAILELADDDERAPLGAAYVRSAETGRVLLLVAAAPGTRDVEVRHADGTVAVDGPLAVVPATWVVDDGFRGVPEDVELVGRDADGARVTGPVRTTIVPAG